MKIVLAITTYIVINILFRIEQPCVQYVNMLKVGRKFLNLKEWQMNLSFLVLLLYKVV